MSVPPANRPSGTHRKRDTLRPLIETVRLRCKAALAHARHHSHSGPDSTSPRPSPPTPLATTNDTVSEGTVFMDAASLPADELRGLDQPFRI
ncbi:hypothetical protein [Streptomyces sp. CNQ-509]|uniref:hypothetical protein n=1 Tax=Streptomyces sp. CNQ-509 TaxID=444103 RepID=UPI0013DDF0F8|nr:hypothetical protein [Streptomyces sp. CNQ-509]